MPKIKPDDVPVATTAKKGGKSKIPLPPPPPPEPEVEDETEGLEELDEDVAISGEKPIIYPKLGIWYCYLGGKEGPINIALAKKILGWESEAEYIQRVTSTMTDKEKAKVNVKFKDYLLVDETGEKVKCWNNDKNRPFAEAHSRKLAQDILNRQWAGPSTMAGETVNGETIIISMTGRVTSGQHRLVAEVLAHQMWEGKNKNHWLSLWPTPPVIESLVAVGVSDSPKVIQTLDNTKPRTLSDTFYTSEIFQSLAPSEKRECSRMLEKAVEFLWVRSGAGTGTNSFSKYQTHSESRGFLDRHPKLLDCVTHLFGENKERSVSALKLSPGQCAGVLYVMGSSATDGDVYRNQETPSEEVIDWECWKDACNFWSLLSNSKDPQLDHVRKALGNLVDEDTATGGRIVEKFCVLAKAWNAYRDGISLSEEELALEYVTRDDGKHLDEWPDFGGIDIGPKHKEPDAAPPTEEEIQKRKEEERQRHFAEMKKKLAANKAKKAAAK